MGHSRPFPVAFLVLSGGIIFLVSSLHVLGAVALGSDSLWNRMPQQNTLEASCDFSQVVIPQWCGPRVLERARFYFQDSSYKAAALSTLLLTPDSESRQFFSECLALKCKELERRTGLATVSFKGPGGDSAQSQALRPLWPAQWSRHPVSEKHGREPRSRVFESQRVRHLGTV